MMVPVRTSVWLFPEATASETVDAVRAAERAGIDEIWLGDEGPAREPFSLLAAAAVVTERITLGVSVTNPYLRHPALTAATAMTLNELSGGRFVLGIGAGGGMALGPVGIARDRPLARTRDAVRIIRAVADRRATEGFDPPGHSMPAAPLQVVVGARGERFNRFASEAADGVFLGGIPRSVLPDTIGWARSVRPIDVGVHVNAVASEQALEHLRPAMIWTLVDAPLLTRERLGIDPGDLAAAVTALNTGDDSIARRIVDDRVLAELVLAGSPAEIAAGLRGYVDEFSPTTIGLLLHPEGDAVGAVEAAGAALHELSASLAGTDSPA
jgi:5,10-methylenetetrahydromethanopterin reductase